MDSDEKICQEKWKAMCEVAKTGVGYWDDPREEWDIPTRPAVKTKTRRRKPMTLARAKKQAAKAGLEVAHYELGSGGTIKVILASPDQPSDNPWDSVQ